MPQRNPYCQNSIQVSFMQMSQWSKNIQYHGVCPVWFFHLRFLHNYYDQAFSRLKMLLKVESGPNDLKHVKHFIDYNYTHFKSWLFADSDRDHSRARLPALYPPKKPNRRKHRKSKHRNCSDTTTKPTSPRTKRSLLAFKFCITCNLKITVTDTHESPTTGRSSRPYMRPLWEPSVLTGIAQCSPGTSSTMIGIPSPGILLSTFTVLWWNSRPTIWTRNRSSWSRLCLWFQDRWHP